MRLPPLPPASGHALPLWPPLLAARYPGTRSELHAHHAMHFVLAIEGELKVRTANGRAVTAPGVLVAADALHGIDAAGCEVLVVFIDPESVAGQQLTRALGADARFFTAAQRDALLQGAEPSALMGRDGPAFISRALLLLDPVADRRAKRIHPRVRKLLRLLREDAQHDRDLDSLAAAVELSPGRLMHVFTESVGIPLRPYLAWLKLQRATAAIAAGAPLARAAEAGGFADAAHMTRTVRRMLGVTPSALRRPSGSSDSEARGASSKAALSSRPTRRRRRHPAAAR